MTKLKRKTPPSDSAPPDVQKHVAARVAEIGVVEAAKELGIGREAVTRIVGGLGVRAGTIASVRAALAVGG